MNGEYLWFINDYIQVKCISEIHVYRSAVHGMSVIRIYTVKYYAFVI